MYKNYLNSRGNKGQDVTTEKLFSEVADMLRELVVLAFGLKLEMAEEEYDTEGGEAPIMVMSIHPAGQIDICTDDEGLDLFGVDVPDEDAVVFDGQLLLSYDSDDVVELAGVRYLLGTAIVREIDEDGNDCSITSDTIRDAFDYMEANLTAIEVDGKEIPAFRLVE